MKKNVIFFMVVALLMGTAGCTHEQTVYAEGATIAAEQTPLSNDSMELEQFTLIQPDNPNIEYYGRWDKSDPDSYHSYWGGAYLKVRFTGTSVQIKLNKAVTLISWLT